MATMAVNCMTHIELMKEREDLRRIKHMNMCLAAFVDPEHRVFKKRSSIKPGSFGSGSRPHSPLSASRTEASPSNVKPTGSPISAKDPASVPVTQKTDTELASARSTEPASVHGSHVSPEVKEEQNDSLATMKNAALLLHKGLSLEPNKGGVIFLDNTSSLSDFTHSLSWSDDSSDEEADIVKKKSRSISYQSWTGSSYRHTSEDAPHRQRLAEVLASSVHSSSSTDESFMTISQHDLAMFIKKYPRGMLFKFDDDESGGTSSGEERASQQTYELPTTKSMPTSAETALLRTQFPQAKQIIFLPVWNPSLSRYSAFFAYNSNPYRSFERTPEFLNCIEFCHCLTTELSRMDTVNSDRQKSDFIGSISHELRSPLHGILASCEFLEDSPLSSFQKDLISTADACARTLLDTINMVLDYSKIDHLESTITKTGRSKKSRAKLTTTQLQPALSIYGDVDLAAITEEVVEGVATGQVFKDRLADIDVVDWSDTSRRRGERGGTPDVEIILDIAPRNWTFMTQPGAFRRVVMNVFGNSLKYTSRGFIRVKLDAHSNPKRKGESEETETISLVITDTGQGISPQYMKTKLFTPFAQESSIAPGTGLGLSLVRSIVRMLNGEIAIKSSLGLGTTVTIKFPMIPSRSLGNTTSTTTPSSSGSIERPKDESVKIIQSKAQGRSALYFTSSIVESQHEAPDLTRDVIYKYLEKWYGFTIKEKFSKEDPPDIILVPQVDFRQLVLSLAKVSGSSILPPIVVICSAGTWEAGQADKLSPNIESISYPFGPYKLAKILKLCLDKLEGPRPTLMELEGPLSPLIPREARDEVPEVVQAIDQIKLGGDVKVVQQGQIMANEEFAPLMVDALSAQSTRSIEQGSGFPFPPADESTPLAHPQERPTQNNITPTIDQLRAPQPPATVASASSTKPSLATSNQPSSIPLAVSSTPSTPPRRSPRLLLVDDNKVNLRLLNTFMQKRGYSDMHLASDGAVSVFIYESLISQSPPAPPDIIFMDISMPVMNGFEAARRIRELEASFHAELPPLATPPTSMIIALTGLASSRDQSEAFTSGFDLYLVKPISFKSVAKLLDSWERNGGAAIVGSVPRGQLAGDDVSSVMSLGSEGVRGAMSAEGAEDTTTEEEEEEHV
jgi:signal transduction histidine kinase/CheY-like chemotaxis protein